MKKAVYARLILFSLNLFVGLACYGQLYVPKDASVSIGDVFSSQYKTNIINSTVHGKRPIHFNAKVTQNLVTKENISLPGINVDNTSTFNVLSSFKIRGDISVKASQINLFAPIFLEGGLFVLEGTKIFGEEFICYVQDLRQPHAPLSTNHKGFKPININYCKSDDSTEQLFYHLKHKYIFFKNKFVNSFAIAIPTPPPENILKRVA